MDFFPCPCFPLLFSFPKLTHLEVHPPAQSPMASLWGSIPICISSLHHLCARGLRVGGRGLLGEYKYVTMSGGGLLSPLGSLEPRQISGIHQGSR